MIKFNTLLRWYKTVLWTSKSKEKKRSSVNIWPKEFVSHLTFKVFPTMNEDMHGKKNSKHRPTNLLHEIILVYPKKCFKENNRILNRNSKNTNKCFVYLFHLTTMPINKCQTSRVIGKLGSLRIWIYELNKTKVFYKRFDKRFTVSLDKVVLKNSNRISMPLY